MIDRYYVKKYYNSTRSGSCKVFLGYCVVDSKTGEIRSDGKFRDIYSRRVTANIQAAYLNSKEVIG